MKRLLEMLKYSWLDWRLQQQVKKKFYTDPKFAKLDRALLTAYIFKSPYAISRSYLKNHQEKDIHTYGETPLTTYETIAQEVGLTEKDTFLELGSGRGRGALFLNHFYRCHVIGVERIPQFVKLSRYLAQKHSIKGVSFLCADMLQAEIPQANIVYLYGTCLSDENIKRCVHSLKKLPYGTKIVTISYPLTDYDESGFQIEKSFPVSFAWGTTDAYLQTYVRPS